jgi:hypothetical protein
MFLKGRAVGGTERERVIFVNFSRIFSIKLIAAAVSARIMTSVLMSEHSLVQIGAEQDTRHFLWEGYTLMNDPYDLRSQAVPFRYFQRPKDDQERVQK